ncbi:hypothetical protein GGQ81_003234 [Sphingomonas desiccabilis]|nr:hypothetical protein [Sphingomonas desiccabilis]
MTGAAPSLLRRHPPASLGGATSCRRPGSRGRKLYFPLFPRGFWYPQMRESGAFAIRQLTQRVERTPDALPAASGTAKPPDPLFSHSKDNGSDIIGQSSNGSARRAACRMTRLSPMERNASPRDGTAATFGELSRDASHPRPTGMALPFPEPMISEPFPERLGSRAAKRAPASLHSIAAADGCRITSRPGRSTFALGYNPEKSGTVPRRVWRMRLQSASFPGCSASRTREITCPFQG